jgi:sugar/nucleoside kinase (ribokinase family)
LIFAIAKGMCACLAPDAANAADVFAAAEAIVLDAAAAQQHTGITPDCEVHIALTVKKLRGMGARVIVLLPGKTEGAVAVGQEITILPPFADEPNVAAGDAFASALAVRMAQGENIIDAAQFATAAALCSQQKEEGDLRV